MVSGSGIVIRRLGQSELKVVKIDEKTIKLFNNKSELLSKGVVINLQNDVLNLSDNTTLGASSSFDNLSSKTIPREQNKMAFY